MRDQFVYGVSNEELKKRLLEGGNTLTRIEATSIGKGHESTKLEVLDCSAKQPAKENVNAVSKDKQRKVLMCVITVPKRKELIASQTKNSVLPGEQYAENARSKISTKIQRSVNGWKERDKENSQIQNIRNRRKHRLSRK